MDDDETHEDFETDEERELEDEWHRETGSSDPQGPPEGWTPRRTHEDG